MDDLISRQAAIDALDGELTITGRTNAEAVRGYVKLVKDRLERLPSATDTNVGIKLGTNLAEVGTDCISRQSAIDAVDKRIQFLKDDPVFRRKHGDIDLYGIKPIIQTLPSAQPKKGKWIRHSIGHMNIPWGYDCSACGAWFVINDDAFKRYDFCPNCGSDNRGEQDG